MVHLGRSFAVLVSVRKIVSSGPYAYVRHPIYLGYAIDLCGLLLATSSIAMFTLAAGWVLLLIIRARIEEEMLSEADEGYRQYVTRTNFLFPRSFKPLR
jgi:protein-S-isoprenylcysteine O-methyltransferase Ste14